MILQQIFYRQYNQHCTIFSHIFCSMFLIDAVKHNVEEKFNLFNFFTLLFGGASLQNKTSFVSFCVMFTGCNKNFIQNKQEIYVTKD